MVGTDDIVERLVHATGPAFTSMLPQEYSGQITHPVNDAIASDSLRSVNDSPISNTGQGWWITPETVAKHPELKTVLDVLEHPVLFADARNSTQGVFVGCPVNSICHPVNANLFRAFQMKDKGWKLQSPGSWSDLAHSISTAIEQGQNWFGYHESPSAITGKHNMIKLDFGVEFAGTKNWNGCMVKPVSDCTHPKPTAWRQSSHHTLVTNKFTTAIPSEVQDYLSTRIFPGNLMSHLLAEQIDKQLTTMEMAKTFLLGHKNAWQPWVSAEVASKVIDVLSTSN